MPSCLCKPRSASAHIELINNLYLHNNRYFHSAARAARDSAVGAAQEAQERAGEAFRNVKGGAEEAGQRAQVGCFPVCLRVWWVGGLPQRGGRRLEEGRSARAGEE